MKRIIRTLLIATLSVAASLAQEATLKSRSAPAPTPVVEAISLPTFDLDFPGGTPGDLAAFIEKQVSTFNALIPVEYEAVRLPPMKMKRINVKQLFDALEAVTRRSVIQVTGRTSYGRLLTSERPSYMTFQTTPPLTPESIWAFIVYEPVSLPQEETVVKYYQLKDLLAEYKIDDITTAIQAGWKMMGAEHKAQLNFHEDTKLLIAAGASYQLDVISSVLEQLQPAMASGTATVDPTTGAPLPKPGR